MKKITVLLILLFTMTASTLFAETELNLLTTKKHQVGLRLGTWINNGDTPPTTIVFFPADTSIAPSDSLTTSMKDVNFFLEGFYAYNFYSSIYTEISFAMVNRGDIQSYSSGNYDFSNILIYPILLQLKLYPLQSTSSKFQPYIGAGGGLYIIKQNIQFSNAIYAQLYQVQGDSKTNFNYTLSGGIDWDIKNKFSLEIQAKYMPIKYSDTFIGISDYSATTITIGFKYKYNNNKK